MISRIRWKSNLTNFFFETQTSNKNIRKKKKKKKKKGYVRPYNYCFSIVLCWYCFKMKEFQMVYTLLSIPSWYSNNFGWTFRLGKLIETLIPALSPVCACMCSVCMWSCMRQPKKKKKIYYAAPLHRTQWGEWHTNHTYTQVSQVVRYTHTHINTNPQGQRHT